MSQLSDVELGHFKRELPNGFATVADFIAKEQDKTSTIYRRFDRLTARNLLYLQARLQKLEKIQDDLDAEVLVAQDEECKRAATSWEDFEALSMTRENEKTRMQIAEEIEKALKTYRVSRISEAVAQQYHLESYKKSCQTLSGLAARSLVKRKMLKLQFASLKHWFLRESPAPKLRGHCSHVLDDETDLLALRVPDEQDRLTMMVQTYLLWLFISEPPKGRVAQISERKVARFVATLSTVLAAILLIGAIVALNYVHSQDWRIALISIFTMLFAGSVGLLTTASRAEVFAATAAYAAVLVVFVSNSGSTRS